MQFHRKLSIFAVILIAINIFYLSSLPNPIGSIKVLDIHSIIYHFGIFALFAFFSYVAMNNHSFLALLFSSSYAGLDELHQFFIPGRDCSFSDFAVDFSGILVALIFFLIIRKISNRK